jgi:predicted Holliday junction resolvase-like endonuclease
MAFYIWYGLLFLGFFISAGFIIYFWRKYVFLGKLLEDQRTRMEEARESLDRTVQALVETRQKLENETEAGREVLTEAAKYEKKFYELSLRYGDIAVENDGLCKEVGRWKTLAEKNLSERKSSEVRVGKIAENFAPFLENFPYNAKHCHFLGQPIDFIVWEDNKIVFVEIKSGKAQLSSSQRNIRDIIANKNVSFEVFRINEKEDEQDE